jgi:hypothetical protein
MMPRLALVIITVCLWANVAGATTWQVPGDRQTIAEALAVAAAGDTVLIADQIFREHDLVIPSGVCLRSEGGATIDAFEQGPVIVCDGVTDVVIEDLVITRGRGPDGSGPQPGGGIIILDAEVRIVRCRIVANAASRGAGIGALRASLTVEDCEIRDNRGESTEWAAGGGLWAETCSGVVNGCLFAQNTTHSTVLPGDGGGMFAMSSSLAVTDCVFTGNITGGGGGGFYSWDYDASVITHCTFTDNQAQWGGAAYLERSRATLTDCSFIGGRALSAGAVELNQDSIVAFVDCGFTGNEATLADGGAIQSWDSAITLTRCRFSDNRAAAYGGAVKLGGTDAQVEDSIFSDNHASQGGAVYCHWSPPRFTGCTFASNGASEQAGGIYVNNSSSVVLERCILAFSTAGTALAGGQWSTYTLSCTDIYGNAGGDWTAPIADQLAVDGNLSVDPLFCGLASGDLTLDAASSCAADANPACGQIGALPANCFTTVVPDAAAAPALTMAPPVPNPFNPATQLRFSLASAGATQVSIVDLAGRRVRTLHAGPLAAGTHRIAWDGRDEAGLPAAAGIYHAVVVCGTQSASVRLALLR